MRRNSAAGLAKAGLAKVGCGAMGAAVVVVATMLLPRVTLAAAAANTPVRGAGAAGVGDTIGPRVDASARESARESAALANLRARVGRQGYLLNSVRWDPVLRQSWAVLESVGHPEWPYVSVLVPLGMKDTLANVDRPQSGGGAGNVSGNGSGVSFATAGLYGAPNQFGAAPVVHMGDKVTLWSEESNLHVQLTAVAEQNGGVGDRIRLHVMGMSFGSDQSPQRMTGIVRAAGSVEITQ